MFTDGPFLESKEYLAGFWIMEAADLDVALKLAAEGSKACNRKVEVRPRRQAEGGPAVARRRPAARASRRHRRRAAPADLHLLSPGARDGGPRGADSAHEVDAELPSLTGVPPRRMCQVLLRTASGQLAREGHGRPVAVIAPG